MQSFTTEFGHTIPFVPGYFERNKGFAYYTQENEPTRGATSLDSEPLDLGQPVKNWVAFSSLIHFLAKYRLMKKRGRGIDLGGAAGTLIRLFKALGQIEHATNVDLVDYSAKVSDAYYTAVLKLFHNVDKQPPVFQKGLLQAKQTFAHFDYAQPADGMITGFPAAATLDQNLHMDLLQTSGAYDLVTSVMCLVYFDPDKILAKIRDLLNPGGLFVGHLEYWWWPTNSTGIIGDFPYIGARLSHNDLRRYFAEHHPDLLPNVEQRYHYFHEGRHPTVGDWCEAALRNGLRPVAMERVIPVQHPRLAETPPTLFSAPWFDYREVLRDIHHLTPDVTVDDLFTSGLRLALIRA